MSLQLNSNRNEPNTTSSSASDSKKFLDSVREGHRKSAIHAIEKQKESLTLNPVHFSVVGDLDGSMSRCILLLGQA